MKKDNTKQNTILSLHKKGWELSSISYCLKVSQAYVKQTIEDSKNDPKGN